MIHWALWLAASLVVLLKLNNVCISLVCISCICEIWSLEMTCCGGGFVVYRGVPSRGKSTLCVYFRVYYPVSSRIPYSTKVGEFAELFTSITLVIQSISIIWYRFALTVAREAAITAKPSFESWKSEYLWHQQDARRLFMTPGEFVSVSWYFEFRDDRFSRSHGSWVPVLARFAMDEDNPWYVIILSYNFEIITAFFSTFHYNKNQLRWQRVRVLHIYM